MTPRGPSNIDIFTEVKLISSQVGEIKGMSEASNRILRGVDGEIGLVARVNRNEEKTTEIFENTKVLPELVQSIKSLTKIVNQLEARPCREEGRILALEEKQTQLSGIKTTIMDEVKTEIKTAITEAVSPDHVFRMEDLRTKLFWPVTLGFIFAISVLLVAHNINPILP